MKKHKWIYRGVSERTYRKYKEKGIPKGTAFMTDPIMARKFGKKVIAINKTKTGFTPRKNDNKTFKSLKIGNRYFTNKSRRKRFTLIGNM